MCIPQTGHLRGIGLSKVGTIEGNGCSAVDIGIDRKIEDF
jgi:hypothetical protein